MRKWTALIGILLCGLGARAAEAGKDADGALYENDFEQAELNKVPDEFLVLAGQFAVREEAGNKFLELPGAPLETFGVLFGPSEKDGVAVSARIHGRARGRRFPVFGVGLDGVGGYRLQVSPAKQKLELYKGDNVVATKPYIWKSDTWTTLRLEVLKAADGWSINGRVTSQGAEETKAATIYYVETKDPIPGMASIWGSPFSGTPIRYDDLKMTRVGPAAAQSSGN